MVRHEHGVGEEHPHSHHIQFGSVVIFFIVWGVDSFVFRISTFLEQFIPLDIRLILFFSLVSVGCILIFVGGHSIFHENKGGLVKTGLLAHTRHPLYFGVQLNFIGCFFLTMSLISLGIWIVIFILYDRIATYEEQDLERIFGEEYREYKKRVPKWIPR